MKKYFKYILIAILVLALYKGIDKILDISYLNQFTINDYTGNTRYTTVNKVIEKRFKKSDTAILVNTDYVDEIVPVSTYAYKNNLPVYYTEKYKVLDPVYKSMKKLGVKKVIIMGGINSLSKSVDSDLSRNGFDVERIIAPRGIDFSIKIADLIANNSKFDSLAIVYNNQFDLPNGISFSTIAQSNNIPIIVTANDMKDFLKIKDFVKKYNIKNTYIISNEGSINPNLKEILTGNITEIYGKDRYDVNVKIIKKFFTKDKNSKIFVSKGGELVHKRDLSVGQLINAIAISPLASDNKSPLFMINDNYFNEDESKIISENGYSELNEVGFKIVRKNYFSIERIKTISTIALIAISLLIPVRLFILDKSLKLKS